MVSAKKRTDHNWKSHRQHDYSYYQTQPSIQDRRQQYLRDIIIQQNSLKNDNNRDKWVSYGMIRSGITTPEKQSTPIIPLEKYSYS